jgi:hypothetical protein
MPKLGDIQASHVSSNLVANKMRHPVCNSLLQKSIGKQSSDKLSCNPTEQAL